MRGLACNGAQLSLPMHDSIVYEDYLFSERLSVPASRSFDAVQLFGRPHAGSGSTLALGYSFSVARKKITFVISFFPRCPFSSLRPSSLSPRVPGAMWPVPPASPQPLPAWPALSGGSPSRSKRWHCLMALHKWWLSVSTSVNDRWLVVLPVVGLQRSFGWQQASGPRPAR